MDSRWLRRYAARVREEYCERGRFRELFTDSAVLVPVPSCRCERTPGDWAAARLANELHLAGLARAVWLGLRRQHRVRKSATAAPGERPSVWQHFDSLRLEPALIASDRLVLVDDVITKGRTLLAASMALRGAFPQARVSAFALVRTLGWVNDITGLVDPCEGEIRWLGEDARRRP
jgi:predicted amidophosphoribosyltransferase